MLIPRFSLRYLLALTTFCAGLSLVASLAIRQHVWAIGIMAAFGTITLLAFLFVSTFLVAWLVAQVERAVFGGGETAGVSPFARGKEIESPFGEATPLTQATQTESPSPVSG